MQNLHSALLTLSILMTFAISASSSSAMTLAKEGKAAYTIVTSSSATAPEVTAAKELQKYLNEVTGASFEVRREAEVKATTPQILVGQSEKVKRLLPDVDWKSLGQDGIVIRTVGDTLVLAGGRPRGSLYAVYTFLEDTVGCRWWTSTENFIPKKKSLTISKLSTQYAPKIKYREAFYIDTNQNPMFDVKLKLNGHHDAIPAEYGGHYSIIGWCHTFWAWIPPQTYFESHPEWFSEINGKRVQGWAESQLCLTNQELIKEMTRVCLAQIRKNPSAGIISISQNDWYGRCECEKCKAVEAEEGAPSGPLIRFVNAVAEGIEKEYPDFLVETLAYQYTRKPPLKVKPRRNVIVRLCTIDCDFSHPLDSEENKSFRDDINRWAEISPNLYIWDYVTNFCNYIPPQPNMGVLAPNLRLFEKSHAIAVFEQGDAECSVGDFVRHRTWLISHLLWNPNADEKKLTREFLNGYYGPAGKYIGQYFDVIHSAMTRHKGTVGCMHGDISFWNLAELTQAKKLMDKAEASVAGDKIFTERILRDRMPIDYLWLLRYKELKQAAEKTDIKFIGPKDPNAASEDFIKRLEYWQVKQPNYYQGIDSLKLTLRTMFAQPPPTPEEISKLPKEDVIEFQEDRLQLAQPGVAAKIVDDPKASNGKAASMPANHRQWAIQCHIPEDIVKANPGKWQYCVIARCDALKDSGPAFQYGIYNQATGQNGDITETLSNASDGNYRTYSLGVGELNTSTYVWVAPYINPDQVKNVYVDRVVLIRDKLEN